MKNLDGKAIKGYELAERIGSGGFGAVYRAYQSTIGREVAVKIILPGYANHPDFIRRFEREAQLIARLEHLHIVPLYDYWREPNSAYLVMRWLRGGSVGLSLKQGAFDLEPATVLLEQVAAALATAHGNGIIHRDLKPSNILLDEEGNAYLADFGIAKDLQQKGEVKGLNTIIGSPAYLSPEQARNEPITPQTDIYSLGVTMYELLTGKHPFESGTTVERILKNIHDPLPWIQSLDSSVNDEINEVIQQATAKNPARRFEDALAMAAAFKKAARLHQNSESAELLESLTLREQEILKLIIDGHTNRQIAQELFIEASTVKWHIRQLYRKLGVRSRRQAMIRARELDLLVSVEGVAEGKSKESVSRISLVLPAPVNPFKGLRSFETADSRDYFGRETLVEKLLAHLTISGSHRDAPSQGRFLAVIGPSGSGKSSLVKAGLIPALMNGALKGSERWYNLDLTPGSRPLDELEVALMRVAADQADNIRYQLDRDENGLLRVAELILPKDGSELVLIIDQFEELFTRAHSETERAQFLKLLVAAATDMTGRVRVVVVLRADYFDRPLRYPEFGGLMQQHTEIMLPLSAQEMEQAIVRPAERVGVGYEQGLVAGIIDDVLYQPGALPLMQYALTELFEQRDDRLLTQQAYENIGGAIGALARRAEALYLEQDEDGKETIRQMFLRLVTAGDLESDLASNSAMLVDTSRRVLRSELLSAAKEPEQLEEIIDTFADYRLLSLDHDPLTRQPTVEVAHEAILREWERLRIWLEENQADLAMHRQLIRATGEWLVAGGDESFLLRGTRLSQIESWAEDTDLELTADEQSFLESSIQQRLERNAAELDRREQKAHLEKRANRRLKALVVVMALALVVAIGLTIAAFTFARQVEEQRRLAEQIERLNMSRELTTGALANLESDPELSVLLALEAAEMTMGSDGTVPHEIESVLRQAIQKDLVHLTIRRAGTVAFNPAGESLAIMNGKGVLRNWDPATGQPLWERLSHHGRGDRLGNIAFSSDGRLLASVSHGTLAKIWDVASGRNIAELAGQQNINDIAFGPDSQQLWTAGSDGMIRVWDLGSIAKQLLSGEEKVELSNFSTILHLPTEVNDIVISPSGWRVAVLTLGKIITIDPASGQRLIEIDMANRFATEVALNKEGNLVAGNSSDLAATIWDARTGQEILKVLDTARITEIAFDPAGRFLALGNEDGAVTLFSTANGQEAARFSGHEYRISSLSFSPDGQQLASSSENGVTRVWDIKLDDSDLLTIAAHNGEAYDAVFDATGSKIASSGMDGSVKVWDAATGEMIHDLPGQRNVEHFPTFSPDGTRLAAANERGGISIWDAGTGTELFALEGKATTYTAISFSPDGARLAAGGQDGMAYIWDATTARQLTDISHEMNDDIITELVFTPDGTGIRSYYRNGLEIAWNAVTGEQMGTASGVRTIMDVELTREGDFGVMACSQIRIFQAGEQPDAEQNLHYLQSEVTGIAIDPDGSVVASASSRGELQLWNMESGEKIATLVDTTTPFNGVDFSSDGEKIVVAGADGKLRLYAMSIEELMEIARSKLSRDFTWSECQQYLNLAVCPDE